MKALQINKYGDSGVAEIINNAPKPATGDDSVLVKVHAAGVNPVDWKIREGYLKEVMPLQFPATLGVDFSGMVMEVGKNVKNVQLEDKVYGMANALTGGSFAEYVAVPAGSLAHKPEKISYDEAAAVPLAGLSALQALTNQLGLSKEQKILIHGGAGGIGTFAIQIAKQLGAEVAATVRREDAGYAKELGADLVIDYKNEKFEDVVKNYDTVFDTVGGETYERSFAVLKKGGTIVSMVEQPNDELMKRYEVGAKSQFTQPNSAQLAELANLIDQRKLVVKIDEVFSLDNGKKAFDRLQNGHPRGKVVIHIA